MSRRRHKQNIPGIKADAQDPVLVEARCGLCLRPVPPGSRSSKHHLVPKSRGGKVTVLLHQICHSTIHAFYGEKELERRLCDLGSLRADPEIARFVEWVRTKPNGFHAQTRRKAGTRG